MYLSFVRTCARTSLHAAMHALLEQQASADGQRHAREAVKLLPHKLQPVLRSRGRTGRHQSRLGFLCHVCECVVWVLRVLWMLYLASCFRSGKHSCYRTETLYTFFGQRHVSYSHTLYALPLFLSAGLYDILHQGNRIKATEEPSGICCRVGAHRRFGSIYKRLGNRVRELQSRPTKFQKKRCK